MEEGKVVEVRETMLPLLLSSLRRINQWSDIDELVDPLATQRNRRKLILWQQDLGNRNYNENILR